MIPKIGLKCCGILRADDNHAGLPSVKFNEVPAQLRHMLLAEWSIEPAIEDEQDVGLAGKLG